MITEYELYSDERKDTPKGYLILGGIVCTDRGRDRLLAGLSEARECHGLYQEIGWGKVSKSYLDGFKAYLDVFFDDPHARYSVLVVHRASTKRPKMRHDDMLASIYYQFLLTTFGRLSDTKRWWVYPDAGFFSKDTVLDRVEFLFNRTYKRAFGPKTSRIVRLARALNSKRSDLIQLTDLMLGCVAFAKFDCTPESAAKLEFLAHFKERRDASFYTKKDLARFVIHPWVPPEQFEYPAWGAKSPGAPQ